mgnify:CR=1 FL=1
MANGNEYRIIQGSLQDRFMKLRTKIQFYGGGFGNGNTYYIGVTNRYPDKFTKIVYSSGTQLQAGDIISLEGSQKQYGHAAIVKSVSGNNITILEQWAGSIYVIQDTFTLTTSGKRRIIGIARPK